MKTGTKTVSESRSNSKEGHRAAHAHQSNKFDPMSADNDCPLEQIIAEASYSRAEQRGFTPGHELSDRLQAEADVEGSMGHGRQ